MPDVIGTVNGVIFNISTNDDPDLINVKATIPAPGTRHFARLKGTP